MNDKLTTIDPKLELVKTSINLELTKAGLNYQKLLQDAENIVFTKETINQDYEPLKKLAVVIKKIRDVHKERKAPYLEKGRLEDEAAKTLSDPLTEVLERKKKQYAAMVEDIRKEAAAIQAAKAKREAIVAAINNFVLENSQKIANAQTDKELVDIERLINLEATRTLLYGDAIEEFKAACLPLRELLKKQKEDLRNFKKFEDDIAAAFASEDDAKAIELTEKRDALANSIVHNQTIVQEQAIASTISNDVEQIAPVVPKARMKRWTAEIVDVEKAFNNARDMLNITLVPSKVSEALELVKQNLGKEKKSEIIIDGIRYYQSEKF